MQIAPVGIPKKKKIALPPPFARDSRPVGPAPRTPDPPYPYSPGTPNHPYYSPGNPGGPGNSGPDPPAAAPPPVHKFSLEDDPNYQQWKADALRAFEQATGGILKDKTSLLLQLGDRGLAQSELGANYAGLGAITDDPTSMSILGQINRGYNDTVGSAETGLRQHNLGYSGYRGKTLRNLAFEKGKQRAGAIGSAQSQLAQLRQRALDAARSRDDAMRQAASQAFAQWSATEGYS